ncbi:MAG: metal ABC transporter permease [Alphaproteobacteria bacterium]|jgi:zinc transport system permease protein
MADFLVRALLGGVAIALVAGPMGAFVVWRRMAYFGAAMAHTALLGVALGLLLEIHVTLAIMTVCVIAALALSGRRRRSTLPDDTLLGIVAHGALALGLVVIAFQETLRIDLLAYLFGDILAVTWGDLAWIYGGGALALGVMAVIWRPLLAATVHEELAQVEGVAVDRSGLIFMVLLAVVIAVGLKLVGLLLITSLLIIPAAAARALASTPEQMALGACLIGGLSVIGGLYGSLMWDSPAGPSIVIAAVLLFAATRLVRKRA